MQKRQANGCALLPCVGDALESFQSDHSAPNASHTSIKLFTLSVPSVLGAITYVVTPRTPVLFTLIFLPLNHEINQDDYGSDRSDGILKL